MKRGLSLAEAIIAMFILLGGFTVTFRLYHSALQYSSLIEAQQLKVRVAQNKLEEIRAWSRQQHQPVGNVPFADWSHWHNTSGADADYPQIRWTVQALPVTLASPCTLFDSIQSDPSQRRTLTQSYRQLVVTADTGPGSRAVTLSTYLGQPSINPAPAGTCQIALGGATGTQVLHHRDQVTFQASLIRSSNAAEIYDMFFHWKVDNAAGQGNGTLAGLRTGRSMTFTHVIRIKQAAGIHEIFSAPGRCQAKVLCVYRGKLHTLNTPDLDLQN